MTTKRPLVLYNGSIQELAIGDTVTGATVGSDSWVELTPSVTNLWRSVCYGNNQFVAIAQSGIGNRAMVSADGVNWLVGTTPADYSWQSVCYGDGIYVAVGVTGTGNNVMTSLDGVNWTLRTAANSSDWKAVCYGNGQFVAVASSGLGSANRVMTSPNGITWTTRVSASDNYWTSICYGNGLYVAVARTSGDSINVMTSPDGITWTTRTAAANTDWASVCYGNGLFVAVSYAGIANSVMTSPDGITWTIRTATAANMWQAVCYGNGMFIATANSGTGNRAMMSTDGITWTAQTSATDKAWWAVCYGNGAFVALSGDGGGANKIMVYGRVVSSAPQDKNAPRTAYANTWTNTQDFRNTVDAASLGSELTTNGTFTGNATGWTLGAGWAYSSNNIVCTLSGSAEGTVTQNISVTSGSYYLVTWDQTNSVSNSATIQPSIGAASGLAVCPPSTALQSQAQLIVPSATGSLALTFTVADSTSTGTITIDNVSVKEILTIPANITLTNSSGTIITESRAANVATFTAVGINAGKSTIDGTNNSFMGSNAGKANTTGNRNSFFGSSTGANTTTGVRNTFIGVASGAGNTVGSYNSALGDASYRYGTGSYNTCLGHYTGLNITTGSNNTLIGYNAQPSVATVSNEITLGDANVTAVRIPGAANIALNATLPAWNTNFKVIQLNNTAVGAYSNNDLHLWSNAYYDSTPGPKYITTAAAASYYQSAGSHVFRTAASGTAGNAITWNTALTIDYTGLTLGNATSNLINFGAVGVGAPTFTNRSVGTKIVLWSQIGVSAADYGFGIEGSTLWSSVPTTSQQFKWYGGTTLAATLTGAGALTIAGALNCVAATSSGDIRSYRAGSPTTGVYYFSQSGDKYLYYDGTNFTLNGANIFSVTANTQIDAKSFNSVVATGTAPLTVSSSTKVTNLNVDMVDGYHASESVVGSTLATRNPAGYLFGNFFNMTANSIGTAAPSRVPVETGTDGYLRWQDPSYFRNGCEKASNVWLNNTNNGYQLVAGGIYTCMTHNGAFSVALPPTATAVVGDIIYIYNVEYYGWNSWNVYNLTITCSAQTCIKSLGYGESLVVDMDVAGLMLKCIYNDGSTVMWTVGII